MFHCNWGTTNVYCWLHLLTIKWHREVDMFYERYITINIVNVIVILVSIIQKHEWQTLIIILIILFYIKWIFFLQNCYAFDFCFCNQRDIYPATRSRSIQLNFVLKTRWSGWNDRIFSNAIKVATCVFQMNILQSYWNSATTQIEYTLLQVRE